MRRARAWLQLAAAARADLGQKSGPCQTTIRGASSSVESLTRAARLPKRGSTTVSLPPATALLLAGFVGRAVAPKAIGPPCIKERWGNPLRIVSLFRIAQHPITGMRTSGTSDWTTSPEFW